jgi:hypothetical protein
VSQTSPPATIGLGFLTVIQEASGWLGGYLVTNGWGRPLEFRLTTAVQPNRVQSALYGPTLTEYVLADLIGKTLVEKTGSKPDLIVTDLPGLLALRSRIEMPVLALKPQSAPPETVPLTHDRAPGGLLLPLKFTSDQPRVLELLNRIDAAVELPEPFSRIREAVAEARKMGVNARAA